MRQLQCEICKKDFIGKKKARYCSHECFCEARKRFYKSIRKKIVCPWCKKEFFVVKSQMRIFCSYSCNGFYYSSLKNGIIQVKSEKKNIQWSDNIAYLIGLIVTDGTLRKYRKTIRIASKDVQQVENVQQIVCDEITGRKNKIIEEHKKVGEKIFSINTYQFTSEIFYEFCESIGIMPNKSLILGKISIPSEYLSDFLRGVIDGDGNYNVLKREYETYKIYHVNIRIFSASLPFVKWLNDACTDVFNVKKGIVYKETRKIPLHPKYTLFWSNRKAVRTIIKEIYSNANYFLERKKDIINSAELQNKIFANLRLK